MLPAIDRVTPIPLHPAPDLRPSQRCLSTLPGGFLGVLGLTHPPLLRGCWFLNGLPHQVVTRSHRVGQEHCSSTNGTILATGVCLINEAPLSRNQQAAKYRIAANQHHLHAGWYAAISRFMPLVHEHGSSCATTAEGSFGKPLFSTPSLPVRKLLMRLGGKPAPRAEYGSGRGIVPRRIGSPGFIRRAFGTGGSWRRVPCRIHDDGLVIGK